MLLYSRHEHIVNVDRRSLSYIASLVKPRRHEHHHRDTVPTVTTIRSPGVHIPRPAVSFYLVPAVETPYAPSGAARDRLASRESSHCEDLGCRPATGFACTGSMIRCTRPSPLP